MVIGVNGHATPDAIDRVLKETATRTAMMGAVGGEEAGHGGGVGGAQR
jgi:hypothetical protein